MSMLVEQQDETIATIETQAGQVNNDMEQGLKYTEQAVIKARKARRKKWICFWITSTSLGLHAIGYDTDPLVVSRHHYYRRRHCCRYYLWPGQVQVNPKPKRR